MANRAEGVREKIIVCAKQEFLEKGYVDASLRTIAKNAETSTSSIYTHFGDKEGLLRDIVEPTANELKMRYEEVQIKFHSLDKATQLETMVDYSSIEMNKLFDFMYDNFDVFRLLLDTSYGTQFQRFVDELVDIEVEYTYKYMEVIGCDSVRSGKVTEEFIHMVTTAFLNGMFEIFRHNMPKAEGKRYMMMLGKYHHAGFQTIFNPDDF